MKIALLQWDTAWEDREANFDTVQRYVRELVSEEDPDLICLPELFATGFTMNVENCGEIPDGPTHDFLSELSREHNTFVLGSAIYREPEEEKGRNMALLYDDNGERMAQYAKIHPFSYLEEDNYYTAGSELTLIDLEGFTICPLICYDLRFPELFRTAVLNGADCFVLPANWPSSRLDHWKTLLTARAIENQSYIIAPNRTGSGDDLPFPGHSTVIDPWGEVVGQLDSEEGWLCCEILPDRVADIRSDYPFLNDLKPRLLGQ